MLKHYILNRHNNETYGPGLARLVKQPFTHYAIAVAQAGEIRLHIGEGSGRYPEGGHERNDIDEEAGRLFQVGSVSKLITGALMVKLLETGELSLADPVDRFIPEWKLEGVEIGHLLTHTSGVDDMALGREWPKRGEKAAYYRRICESAAFKEQPGKIARYNTHAYALLAEVLERITEQSLERFGREQLFDPLGMTDTTYDVGSVRDRLAYPLDQATGEADISLADNDITGDTGLCTTAVDLLKFGQMVLNGGYFNGRHIYTTAAIDMMLRDATHSGLGKTPIGWLNSGKQDQPFPISDFRRCFSDFHSPAAIGHNGYNGCWLFIDPQYALAGAVLTNSRAMNLDGRHYKKIGNVLMNLKD